MFGFQDDSTDFSYGPSGPPRVGVRPAEPAKPVLVPDPAKQPPARLTAPVTRFVGDVTPPADPNPNGLPAWALGQVNRGGTTRPTSRWPPTAR